MDAQWARSISVVFRALLLAVACTGAHAAVLAGQIDTFEDGTSMGWFFGGGPLGIPATPAANVGSGGPAGAGDAFMRVDALGGAGPRGAAFPS